MEGLQFLYAVINFLILFGALYFFSRKIVSKKLRSRRDRIAAELEQASEARKQVEYLADNIKSAKLANKAKQAEIIKIAREMAEQNTNAARELSEREARLLIENASKGEQLLREEMQERISAETVKKAASLAKDILKQDAFASSRQTLTDRFLDKIKCHVKVMPSDILSLNGLKKHDISILSTQPLSKEQMRTITQNMGEVFISCCNEVDPSISEGVRLRVGNTVYNGNLDYVLDRLVHDVEDNIPKAPKENCGTRENTRVEQVRKAAVNLG